MLEEARVRRTVAIQAGGQSSRMGTDKGLVPLRGRPMIEHVRAAVEDFGDEILVTTNQPDDYRFLDLPLHSDRNPAAGALEGLRTALAAASREQVLVVACDLPFLRSRLLRELTAEPFPADVRIPEWEGRLQPLCALYRRSCLAPVEAALEAGDMHMIAFHRQVQVEVVAEETVRRLDPGGVSFFNVNTPQELKQAERMLANMQTGPDAT